MRKKKFGKSKLLHFLRWDLLGTYRTRIQRLAEQQIQRELQ